MVDFAAFMAQEVGVVWLIVGHFLGTLVGTLIALLVISWR